MFPLRYDIFKFKTMTRIMSISRYRHISSASFNEIREQFKLLKNGCVHLDKEEEFGIAVIALDNPSKKNSISGLMMTQLEDIINNLENWNAGKGVILTSVGNVFCAGSDLTHKKEMVAAKGTQFSSYCQHVLNKLYSLPLITVCLVHDKAVGGGAELTTSTDFRVFSEKGEVCFTQGKMGLITGWGGGTRLVKSFGPRIALDLLCSSKRLKADEALKIGYADHLVTGEDKLLETKQWLNQRLIYPPIIIQSMKKMVVGARDLSFGDSTKFEAEIFSPLLGGPLNMKGLKLETS